MQIANRMVQQVLIIICLSYPSFFYGQVDSDKYSIRFDNESYPAVIKKLSELTGYPILFSDDFFNINNGFSASFVQAGLEDILNELLRGVPLKWIRKGSVFIISKNRVNKVNLHGYIMENTGGEKLPFVTIYCETLGKVFSSNVDGYYNIPLLPGTYQFELSFLGLRTKNVEITIRDHKKENFILSGENILPEVVVDDTKHSFLYNDRNKYSYDKLMRFSERASGIGGSNDLLQMARVLPGVQSGPGGVGGYFIRGGSNDQNLFLLDGVAIYNPFHSLGLTSIFTPQTAKSLQIYKSGFRAMYGDRSSSVVDIKLKDGNKNQYGFEAGINPQDGFVKAEGPIITERSSFLVYGRISTLTSSFNKLIKQSLFPNEESSNSTDYFDIIAKFNTSIGQKNTLFLTFYKGRDIIQGIDESEENEGHETYAETNLSWGNQVISLRWQSLLHPTLYLKLSVSRNEYFSTFGTLIKEEDESQELENLFFTSISSTNRDMEYRVDMDFSPTTIFRLQLGIGYLNKIFLPNFEVFNEDSEELNETETLDFDALDNLTAPPPLFAYKLFQYIEGTWFVKKFVLQFGVRNTYFQFDGSDFFHVQPRLNLDYSISTASVLSLSASKTVQYIHLLSSSEVNLPRDLWYPAHDQVPPEESWHYNLSFKKAYGSGIRISSEVFYKSTQNKTLSAQIAYDKSTEVVELFTNSGTAKAFGIEISADVKFEKWESFLSYALSKDNRLYSAVNLGRIYDFQFDRRHEFKTFTTCQISKHLVLGIGTYVASGHPFLIASDIDLEAGLNPIDINPPGQKNTRRTGFQHRLDLSLSYTKKIGKSDHSFKFNLYNAYNQNLPLFYMVDMTGTGNTLKPNFSIPVIPSLSYTVKF